MKNYLNELGAEKVADLLTKKEAKVDMQNILGETALHWATKQGNLSSSTNHNFINKYARNPFLGGLKCFEKF